MKPDATIDIMMRLKSSLRAEFGRVEKQTTGSLGKIEGRVSAFKGKALGAFDGVGAGVGGMARGLASTAARFAPVAGAVAALTGAVAALGTASVDAAAKFNNEFLALENLNLDKSQAQVGALKGAILDTALNQGFDSQKTAQGFYDVQSALGVYGTEVDAVVTKVGRFAMATKADFNESINQATKGMKAFGLGSGQLDNFLASNAKTVQVGITTFDELARVQTEYAGSAAAAGQDFDTANKVFAAFTAIAKDSNTAATMAKSAFQGLTAKNTIDGMGKAGVSMFDATGKMKSMDGVVRELVPVIASMNDVQFLKFRNKIGGPEGLQNLFNQLRTSGSDVLKTFDAFDNSDFSIDKALKNAKNDFTTISDIAGNRINNVLTRMGGAILPTVVSGIQATMGHAGTAWRYFKGMWDASANIRALLGGVAKAALSPIVAGLKASWSILGDITKRAGALAMGLARSFDFVSKGVMSVVAGVKSVFGALMGPARAIGDMFANITNPKAFAKAARAAVSEFGGLRDLDLSKTFKDGFGARFNAKPKKESLLATPKATAGKQGAGAPGARGAFKGAGAPAGDTLAKGTSARGVRHLTVNIHNMHRGDNYVGQGQGEGDGQRFDNALQFEQWYSEMLIRAARNLEASV